MYLSPVGVVTSLGLSFCSALTSGTVPPPVFLPMCPRSVRKMVRTESTAMASRTNAKSFFMAADRGMGDSSGLDRRPKGIVAVLPGIRQHSVRESEYHYGPTERTMPSLVRDSFACGLNIKERAVIS